ncbi:MAG TPA: HdeD family acid-resistance protein [Streptosporangiaceae bacterium]|nr:HdeD family acid-resistance protein [Streptosporangiaceae bacterium]
MTEPQINRPEPGSAGGLAQERSPAGQPAVQPAVPPQATRQSAGAQTDMPGAGTAAGGATEVSSGAAGGEGGAGGVGGMTAAIAQMAWSAALLAAVGMIAVGIMLLVWPNATLTVVAVLIGVALIVAGLFRLFEGVTARGESGGMRAADIVIGLLAVIAGLYCLKHHALTVLALAVVVGILWVIHGIGDLVVAVTADDVPGRWLKALAGVVSLAAGLLILFWPAPSLVLLLTILGAWLIFYGAVLAGMAFWLRRGARQAARPPQMSAT